MPDTSSMMRKIMDVNFMGYINMTRYALPNLKQSKGQIVVVSSISGVMALPNRTAYCASKFAVNGFFESLQLEEAGNIAVTIYCPSSISGSNFRANSLTGGASQDHKSSIVLSVEQAAQCCINGADRRIQLVIAPHRAWLAGYIS